jgi:hypothetical protein
VKGLDLERVFESIDAYLKDLETEMLRIVDDQTIPLAEKNKLMEPIADTKKVLVQTKAALHEIKNKEYVAGCGMHKMR